MSNWTQSFDDQFNWVRQKGRTASVGTGPVSDHTTKDSKGEGENLDCE